MSIRPIEPGCLAIVTGCVAHPECNGMVVRCISPAHEFFWLFEDAWFVEGAPALLAREAHLTRIDGGEDESVTTEQDQEVTA